MLERLLMIFIFGISMMATLGVIMFFQIQPFAVENGTFTSIASLLDERVLMAALLSVFAGATYAFANEIPIALCFLYGFYYDEEVRVGLIGVTAGLLCALLLTSFMATGNLLVWFVAIIGISAITVVAALITGTILGRVVDFCDDYL